MPLGAPIVQYFSPNDYGNLPTLWSLTQDHRGVMYIGAENGVLEFDGRHWRLTKTPKENLARSLASGADGTIYVGGVAEFGYLKPGPQGETIYHSLSAQLDSDNYRQFDNVWSTHVTTHGVYFVGDNVIYRWHDKQLYTIDSPRRNWGFTIGDQVIVYHRDGGLSKISQGQMEDLPDTEIFSSNTTNRIYIAPYGPGELIIFTTRAGTYRYRLDDTLETTQRLSPFPTEVDAELNNDSLYYQATHDGQGLYYLPTLSGKVLVVNRQGVKVRHFGSNQGLERAGIVTALMLDRDGDLWGTSVNGLVHIQLQSPWTRHSTAKVNESVIIETYLHQDELYASSYHGVYYLAPSTNSDDPNPAFQAVDVPKFQTFAMDSVGDHVVAGIEGRVFALRGTGATKLLDLNQSPMIMAIGQTDRLPGHLFFGTYSNGLRLITFEPGAVTVGAREITLPESELSSQSVRFISQDQEGDLWVATETNGIYQIFFHSNDPSDYDIQHYDTDNGLPDVAGIGIMARHGELAFYHDSDIYRVQQNGRQAHFIAEGIIPPEEVTDNGIIAARFFEDGYFIERKQEMGLYRRRADGVWEKQIAGFTAMPNDKSNGEGTHAADGQYVWVALGDSLYQFDPRQPTMTAKPYPTLIRSVAVGEEVLFGGRFRAEQIDSHSTLKEQLPSRVVSLPYAQNAVRFEYAAAFFQHLDEVQFSYQLEGFDPRWSSWSKETKKEYTNLPEGSYRFLVRSRNAHGDIGQPASYGFGILPPWYRSYWAYLSYLTSALFVLIVSVRAYSWRLLQARKRLEALVKVRTSELENSLKQLHRTQSLLAEASHEAGMARVAKHMLHNVGNALNSIKVASGRLAERFSRPVLVEKYQAVATMLKQHRDDAEFFTAQGKGQHLPDYLEALTNKLANAHEEVKQETTRLEVNLNEIEEILNEQKELTQAASFQERVDLEQLLRNIVQQHIVGDPGEPIHIEFELAPLAPVMLDRHGVQSIVVELLNNARIAMAQQSDRQLHIRLSADDEHLSIQVQDNGSGIEPAKLNLIFSKGFSTRSNAQGKGLHDVANTAAELDGSLSCHSDGPSQGACFTLKLPYTPAGAADTRSIDSAEADQLVENEAC